MGQIVLTGWEDTGSENNFTQLPGNLLSLLSEKLTLSVVCDNYRTGVRIGGPNNCDNYRTRVRVGGPNCDKSLSQLSQQTARDHTLYEVKSVKHWSDFDLMFKRRTDVYRVQVDQGGNCWSFSKIRLSCKQFGLIYCSCSNLRSHGKITSLKKVRENTEKSYCNADYSCYIW